MFYTDVRKRGKPLRLLELVKGRTWPALRRNLEAEMAKPDSLRWEGAYLVHDGKTHVMPGVGLSTSMRKFPVKEPDWKTPRYACYHQFQTGGRFRDAATIETATWKELVAKMNAVAQRPDFYRFISAWRSGLDACVYDIPDLRNRKSLPVREPKALTVKRALGRASC